MQIIIPDSFAKPSQNNRKMKKTLILLLIFLVPVMGKTQTKEPMPERLESILFPGQGLSTIFDGDNYVLMEHYAIELIPICKSGDYSREWIAFDVLFHYNKFEKSPPYTFIITETVIDTEQPDTYYTFKLFSVSNENYCTMYLTRNAVMLNSENLNFTQFKN